MAPGLDEFDVLLEVVLSLVRVSHLVFGTECGIRLYRFLIIAILSTFSLS